jgi:hypothetical protein
LPAQLHIPEVWSGPQTGRSLGSRMLGMDVGDVAVAAYITLLSGAGGFLLWARLNRIESELAGKADKADIEAFRRELAGKADKTDIEALHRELAGKSTTGELQVIRADLEALRREMAIMRSDLTQVALVVGARRSQASEG